MLLFKLNFNLFSVLIAVQLQRSVKGTPLIKIHKTNKKKKIPSIPHILSVVMGLFFLFFEFIFKMKVCTTAQVELIELLR